MIWTNEDGKTYEFDSDHLEKECEEIALNLANADLDVDFLISMPKEHRHDEENNWDKEFHKVCSAFEVEHHADTLELHCQGELIVDNKIKSYIMSMGLDPRLNLIVDITAEEGI